jgi:hypothetical protein
MVMYRYFCRLVFLVSLFLLVVTSSSLHASGSLNFPLNQSGSKYIKAGVRGQFWARMMHLNPGSTYAGKPVDRAIDFSARRVRASIQIKPSDRLFFYVAAGENNFNKQIGRAPKIKLLDLNAEYEFFPQLSVGFGKSGWAGLSRWNVRSSKTMMTLDAPLFYLQTVNINDDLGRAWGAWVKGNEGNWGYVLSLRQPKRIVGAADEEIHFTPGKGNLNYSGYVKYQFLEHESCKTAYSGGCGTYLGAKRVLNVGVGYMYQSEMMETIEDGKVKFEDYIGWNLEAYYDAPLTGRQDWVVTSFAGLLYSDFGPDYVRKLGANDYAIDGSTWSGGGTDYPMMGTGTTLFVQLGILHNFKKLDRLNLQPNLAWQRSQFDVLADPVNVWHGGVNWFVSGHDHKVSIGFENRPLFDDLTGAVNVVDRKTNWVIQYQFEFN